jgi:hypothetical protein
VPAGKEMELVFGIFIFGRVTRLETFHKKWYSSFFGPPVREQNHNDEH